NSPQINCLSRRLCTVHLPQLAQVIGIWKRRHNHMHVVLVDPSRTVLKIVMGLLEGGNHEVHPFTDALAALNYIRGNPMVQALITSAELTSMSGLELCRKVRQVASGGRPIYVILMSSNQDRHRLIEALDNGADDFIGKPPVIEELYARLRAADRVASMQRE